MHVEAMPDGKENPYGNGFVGVETPLTSEGSACRVAYASKGTYWKINNPASRHASTGNSPSFHLSDKCCLLSSLKVRFTQQRRSPESILLTLKR